MVLAMYNGLLGGASNISLAPQFSCPSGNCTWDPFNSLGISSVCVNVTAETTKSCYMDPQPIQGLNWVLCDYTFPSGVELTVSEEWSAPNISFTDPGSPDYADWDQTYGPVLGSLANPILTFSILNHHPQNPDKSAFNATECALQLSVQTYNNVSVHNGIISSVETLSWYATSETPFVNNGFEAYSLQPSSPTAAYSGSNNTYSVDVDTVTMFARYLEQYMSLDCVQTTAPVLDQPQCANSILYQVLTTQPDVDIANIMDVLALSMTNAIRNKGGPGGPMNSTGTVFVQHVFIHVEWFWFILPAIVVLLQLVFLTIIILWNVKSRLVVWKSSSLAVMFHGLQHMPSEVLDRYSLMEERSDELRVRLERDDQGQLRLKEMNNTISAGSARTPQVVPPGSSPVPPPRPQLLQTLHARNGLQRTSSQQPSRRPTV